MLRDCVKTVLISRRLNLILDPFKLISVYYLRVSNLLAVPTKTLKLKMPPYR